MAAAKVEKIEKGNIKKENIKLIEYHLRNYNNYKVAIYNLQSKLDFISQLDQDKVTYQLNLFFPTHSSKKELYKLQIQLNKLIVNAIDIAISELDEIEREFVYNRYFKNYPINKTAIQIGYSDTSIFVIRNQVMDKLLISLSIVYI